jgi:hypothetical protein
MAIVHDVTLALSSDSVPDDGSAAIRAIANPPAACPVCWVEAHGRPLPGNYTTRICPLHAAAMRVMSEARKSTHQADHY